MTRQAACGGDPNNPDGRRNPSSVASGDTFSRKGRRETLAARHQVAGQPQKGAFL